MAIAHSKLTEQGLVLVPDEVLQKLGLNPGSVLEQGEDGEKAVVRGVRRYTSEELHRALFPKPPKAHTLKEMKEGIRRHISKSHLQSED